MATVLIPVPEEHVEEFNRYMLGLTMFGTGAVQTEASIAARDGLQPDQRRFFDFVCRASVSGNRLTYNQVAEGIGIPREDILQLIMEINLMFQRNGAPPCVLTEPEVTTLPDGSVRVEPMVLMLRSVASALV